MNNGNGGDKLYEQIARGAEATQLVVTEVEDLRNQNSRMSSDLMLMRERNNQLEGRLKVAQQNVTTTCATAWRLTLG